MTRLVDSAGEPLPDIEAPSADRLRIYGDLAFLFFRSPRHRQQTVAGLRRYMETPILLGQFRVFRFDDVPRAMYTWAWLDKAGERKLVSGEPLDPQDWQAGRNLWVIDLIAPYPSLTAQIVRWMMQRGNFAEKDFYFRRVGDINETRRVVHIDFDAERLSRVYTGPQYLNRIG